MLEQIQDRRQERTGVEPLAAIPNLHERVETCRKPFSKVCG
jgi:hypothetical protein